MASRPPGALGRGCTVLWATPRLSVMCHKAAHLIIFTRYPVPGQTKTRLIPALGAEGAATLQRHLTEHTLKTVEVLKNIEISIYFSGGTTTQMAAWLGEQWHYQAQQGQDLGDRLIHAFQTSEQQDYDKTVVIGIDCPGITDEILAAAFDKLDAAEVVLGPAVDGGYYLIGLRQNIAALFTEMPWGTAQVFSATEARCQQLNLSLALLPILQDIDEPADLRVWDNLKNTLKKAAE
ncbi:TIGR04282 family arsenosugar biosynthesis glycosyltransferase [Picosynechococcus sp. PCC 7117]|uniref:TIGR04282 family arsenosugar biosynthesis glycosyltransferase n=1 Tax=Picosynechococcus sp. PCC 7117 TaxID=195498 RepID=UPI001E5365D7|nr:TIGR04282 family arsenosugar biosynthesis glycosyltransferase [Picosynechococcus sp. PCC 7117]